MSLDSNYKNCNVLHASSHPLHNLFLFTFKKIDKNHAYIKQNNRIGSISVIIMDTRRFNNDTVSSNSIVLIVSSI